MGAVIRIIARYVIGYAAAKGILPQALLDEIAASPEAAAWIDGLIVITTACIIEGARKLATKRGWSL